LLQSLTAFLSPLAFEKDDVEPFLSAASATIPVNWEIGSRNSCRRPLQTVLVDHFRLELRLGRLALQHALHYRAVPLQFLCAGLRYRSQPLVLATLLVDQRLLTHRSGKLLQRFAGTEHD
jgi:hypothetical protein